MNISNWSDLQGVAAVAACVAALISTFSSLNVRAAVERLRADMAEARAKEREELREWINGSFLRAKVAEAELHAIENRIAFIESEIRRIS